MSKRGVDFLNDWVVEHINPDAYPTENDPRARQYVQECLADAAKSGISRKEIEEDVGNIQGRIIKAMELATDREIEHKPWCLVSEAGAPPMYWRSLMSTRHDEDTTG